MRCKVKNKVKIPAQTDLHLHTPQFHLFSRRATNEMHTSAEGREGKNVIHVFLKVKVNLGHFLHETLVTLGSRADHGDTSARAHASARTCPPISSPNSDDAL